MYRKKFLSKFVIASVLVGGINFAPVILNSNSANLQIASVAHAEIKDVTAKDAAILDFADESAEYTAKVQNVAKMRAIQRARERAGVYLKSFSRTVNGVLTADDISAYTSNKIEVSNVKFQKLFYQVKDVNGNLTGKIGFMYEATVTAKIDTTGLQEYIQKSLQEKQRLIERDKNLRNNIDEISEEFEKLRKNAQNKTHEQIKAEFDQINKKIEETEKTEKTPVVQNKPMIFSQIIKIGNIGNINRTNREKFHQGFEVEGANYNNAIQHRNGELDNKSIKIYEKGLAVFKSGENEENDLYARYDYCLTNNKYNWKEHLIEFGNKNSNLILKSNLGTAMDTLITIYQIKNNNNITLWLIFEKGPSEGKSNFVLLGALKSGKWVKYFDTREITKRFFGEKLGIINTPCYKTLYCKGDTLTIDYNIYKLDKGFIKAGEFKFKWDEKAQWFGVDQVKIWDVEENFQKLYGSR